MEIAEQFLICNFLSNSLFGEINEWTDQNDHGIVDSGRGRCQEGHSNCN